VTIAGIICADSKDKADASGPIARSAIRRPMSNIARGAGHHVSSAAYRTRRPAGPGDLCSWVFTVMGSGRRRAWAPVRETELTEFFVGAAACRPTTIVYSQIGSRKRGTIYQEGELHGQKPLVRKKKTDGACLPRGPGGRGEQLKRSLGPSTHGARLGGAHRSRIFVSQDRVRTMPGRV